MGTRGIPARYGGFETFAEELSTRLVTRGHSVTVFCRDIAGKRTEKFESYRGVSLLYTKTIGQKYLETPVHAFTSNLKLLTRRFDVALLCNAANSPFAWMIRAQGVPLAINVDGIERERAKWNALGRLWYRLGEWTSVLFASKVIGDADVICEYYKDRFQCDAIMIPYGAEAHRRPGGETLAKFGLTAGSYILYVSRLEPENNALGVIEAYLHSGVSIPLVIVGDAPYATAYKESLRAAAQDSSKILFTGFQFGDAYQEFQSNCYLYVQATEVGGTHPALIEAMAYGNCVVANGTPENREVLGDAGCIYQKNNFAELGALFKDLVENPEKAAAYKEKARLRAGAKYSWDAVTDAYEDLFFELARRT